MSPPTTASPPRTPIHAQYATAITTEPSLNRPKPVIVPALPRSQVPSPRSPDSTLFPQLVLSSPEKIAPDAAELQPSARMYPSPVKATNIAPTSASPLPSPSLSDPEPALEDGPLFRAHIALLEKRAHSLRHSLKKLGKALESSLVTLKESLEVHVHLDETLEDLTGGVAGGGSSKGAGDVLGEVIERSLRGARQRKRVKLETDIERGKELGERLRSSVDRLKLVEERKKEFESESKRYYEELAKYLSKPEADSSRIVASDQKQGDRTEVFRQNRIDYFSFVEGILASEEHAIAAWLLAWEGISEEAVYVDEAEVGDTSREGWVHLEEGKSDVSEPSAHARLLDALRLDSEQESPSPNASLPASSNGRPTASRSSTLELPPPVSPVPSNEQSREGRRKRRTSMPHWGLSLSPSAGAEKVGGIKGFIKSSISTAQQSIQSALPSSSSSHNLFSPTSDSFPPASISTSNPSPSAPRTPPVPSNDFLRAPHPVSASHPRKKEGFLYATETGQKHSTAGDGGAKYNRYWVVLSEGQLVEYDRWSDSLSVHGTPINLRYATARISKQAGERRFCFEVLTPQIRRVFQATTDQECSEWVAAISKSVESLLNGTSSVRHFDPSRISGGNLYSSDYASSLSLATDGKQTSHDAFPTSPKGRFAPFLSRHTSLGHSRKVSGSAKKDKRRSVQQTQNVPSFRIGEEDSPRSNRASFDPNSRRGGPLALSEGSDVLASSPSRPMLDGLGIPFPSDLNPARPASRSSPNLLAPRSRATTSPSEGFSTGDEGEDVDDVGSVVSEQDQAISDAVKRWASGGNEAKTSGQGDSKFRNAIRIVEIAEDEALGNGKCADCREKNPKWASWSLGIVLCIRCSGIHRSLGTHISKVRSIELDDWSNEQVAAMESVGNSRSNAFFEAELPPATLDCLNDISDFVKQKYVEKRWVSLVTPTPPATTSTFVSS